MALADLVSTCGLQLQPHPFVTNKVCVRMPFVFLRLISMESNFIAPLAVLMEFPYKYCSGQAFENLVLDIHSARTHYLLGNCDVTPQLPEANRLFEYLFPGAVIPKALRNTQVRLPEATAMKAKGPSRSVKETPWFGSDGRLLPLHPGTKDFENALSGNAYKSSDDSNPHFDGLSAVEVLLHSWTRLLLLWQTKYSAPGSKTTFLPSVIIAWHEEARRLASHLLASKELKVVFVLVVHHYVTNAKKDHDASAEGNLQVIRNYVDSVGDLIVVVRETTSSYLPDIGHRLFVPTGGE